MKQQSSTFLWVSCKKEKNRNNVGQKHKKTQPNK